MFPGISFTAPTYINVGGPQWPNDRLIFLAGPIQGADHWNLEAVKHIHGLDNEVHIASPRQLTASKGDFTADMYKEQVDWEHHYLDYAAKYGVTIFWLANQVHDTPSRAYAQTTRFELGWQFMRHCLLGARMVVGFDTNFSNTKYLKMTLAKYAPDVPLCSSLEETCEKAVELVATL